MFKFFNKNRKEKSGDELFNEALTELKETLGRVQTVEDLFLATDRIAEINKKMEQANDKSMNELVENMLRI
jgi:hypothetical protein